METYRRTYTAKMRENRRGKKLQHLINHQERAEVNRARSHSPLNNPTWHGNGYHALGKGR